MLAALRQAYQRQRAARDFVALARAHPLRYLFFELTRRCNLRCIYCGSDCAPRPAAEELTPAEWLQVLEQVAQDFHPPDVMLALTGGEPLLAPGFFDLVTAAQRLGFPAGVVTNGTLLDAPAARQIEAAGLRAVSLSLDAPPDQNDELRGQGASQAVERALANLRAAGYRGRIELISTIVAPVVPRLAELRAHVARLKVREWRLAPVIPIGRALARPELQLSTVQLLELLRFIRAGRGDSHLPRPELGEECYLGEPWERSVRPQRFTCRAGLSVAGIMHDGRIGACPELPASFSQGDIRRERLATVWAERFTLFRERGWTRRGACASCDAFGACQGGSLHLYPSPDGAPARCFYQQLKDQGTIGTR